MPQFVTGSFNPGVTPQAFNPMTPAIKSALGLQNIRQQGMETQVLPQLLQAALQQQQQKALQARKLTEMYPQILRAEASKMSIPGAVAQGVIQHIPSEDQISSFIPKALHGLHGMWNQISSGRNIAGNNASQSPPSSESASQSSGFVPVKVGNRTVMYNPRTEEWK